MVKKIITLLFLFVCLNIVIYINNKPNTELVFDYIDDKGDYNIYTLSFNDCNLTTNNFNSYFIDPEIQILGIYPKINPLYKHKIEKDVGFYEFKGEKYYINLERFKRYYIDILSKYGLNGEKEKIYLEGVKIDRVKVYASDYQITKIVNKYPKVTYK